MYLWVRRVYFLELTHKLWRNTIDDLKYTGQKELKLSYWCLSMFNMKLSLFSTMRELNIKIWEWNIFFTWLTCKLPFSVEIVKIF